MDLKEKDQGIWLMAAEGGEDRLLVGLPGKERVWGLQWSPDAQRIAYHKGELGEEGVVLESRDLKGSPATVILSDPRLRTFCWMPDGRIVYALKESFDEDDANLWEIAVDSNTGEAAGKPRRLTNWTGFSFSDLSVTADAKRLVFLKRHSQTEVYAGELEASGSGLKTPRRLTWNEREDLPSAWTRESSGVLIQSNRAGSFDVFRHALEERDPRGLIRGPEQQTDALLSPDGAWLLYWSYAASGKDPPQSKRLVRAPVSGGSSQLVLEAGWRAQFRCPSIPAADCVLSEEEKEKKQIIFTAIHPLQGRKGELARVDAGEGPHPPWDLSADGTRIVIALWGNIRVIDLTGKILRSIPVLRTLFDSIAWSADGTAFFAIRHFGRAPALLQISMEGETRILMQEKNSALSRVVASPDGRYLAFSVGTMEANAWVLESE